jgi:hypothetical protein
MRYMNVLIIKNPRRESIGWEMERENRASRQGAARRMGRSSPPI